MTKKQLAFGQALREKRLAKKFSLRRFAELVGISPTYLSQVEQEKVDPPTAERVQRMAELLDENADQWIGLAGRVPEDLSEIFRQQPSEICELLRAASGLSPDQLRQTTIALRSLKGQRNKVRRQPK